MLYHTSLRRHMKDCIIVPPHDYIEKGFNHRILWKVAYANWRVKANSTITLENDAMNVQAQSKPMQAILTRMNAVQDFEIVIFGDEVRSS
jgi:hypothetical protein